MYLQRRFLKFSLRVMTNPEQPLPSLYKIRHETPFLFPTISLTKSTKKD